MLWRVKHSAKNDSTRNRKLSKLNILRNIRFIVLRDYVNTCLYSGRLLDIFPHISVFLSMSQSPWIDWFWFLLSVSHCRLIKISLSATYSGAFVTALMRDLCVEAASQCCSSFPLTHRWNVNNCQVIMWPSPCAGLSNPKVNMQLNCVKTCCPTPLPECLTFLRNSLGPDEIILSTLG